MLYRIVFFVSLVVLSIFGIFGAITTHPFLVIFMVPIIVSSAVQWLSTPILAEPWIPATLSLALPGVSLGILVILHRSSPLLARRLAWVGIVSSLLVAIIPLVTTYSRLFQYLLVSIVPWSIL